MCGIVGYIGNNNAQDFLVSGLKRLEYRGYDSSGIVTENSSGNPTLLKAQGKIINLEQKISKHKTTDSIGIGHTRWATHGEPSEKNAHPHQAGHLFLVHNGIIENYKAIKSQLEKEHQFQSETDSEVLVALINSFYQDGKHPLSNAVTQALKLVQGTYGIAVISDLNPKEIVAARSGSPLVIGVGSSEILLASDASALIGYTEKAIYLNDGEVATITPENVSIKTLDSQPISHKLETIQTDLSAIQKDGYDHFLLKEIMEQPQSLAETLRGRIDLDNHTVRLGGINLSQNSVAVIVSQSGETADTLACLRSIKQQGIKTIGIVNAIGSTIAREVDGGTYVHVGPEISVASTKAFTSQAITIIMFGLMMAQAKGIGLAVLQPFIDEISQLPDQIAKVLQTLPDQIKSVAKKYKAYDHAIYLGRDTAYPIALEGALKLKEISYIDANAYPTGELKHGPLALVDDRFFEVVILPHDSLYKKSISGIQEVLARGGHVIAITDQPLEDLAVEAVIQVDSKLNLLTPILFNIVDQLFAYYVTVARGYDVDQPRNLAKSVTVE